jgi:hypothetical protein
MVQVIPIRLGQGHVLGMEGVRDGLQPDRPYILRQHPAQGDEQAGIFKTAPDQAVGDLSFSVHSGIGATGSSKMDRFTPVELGQYPDQFTLDGA